MTRTPADLRASVQRVVAPIAAIAMTAATAAAQSDLRPPTIKQESGGLNIMSYVVAGLLIAAVVFAASLKPKRTHQD